MSPKNRERWESAKKFLIARLQEASTMRAVVYLIAGGAAVAKPEKFDLIVTVLVLLVGVIGAVMPDAVKKDCPNVSA